MELSSSQPITSFVKDEGVASLLDLEVAKEVKDDELLSGRLTNNLGPVIYQSPSKTEGGAKAASTETKAKHNKKPFLLERATKVAIELPEECGMGFRKS